MIIKESSFLISVASEDKLQNLNAAEFAFVGRSNCGKSSLINFLANKKGLAKTSSTPGLTKLVNYFWFNQNQENKFVLVDLPGYGFSKAGKKAHGLWSSLIEAYLLESKNLKRVFVLVDIRHEPNELDKTMVEFLYYNQSPFTVVATKADKIPKSKQFSCVSLIAKTLKIASGNVIVSSSENKTGRDEILKIIEENL